MKAKKPLCDLTDKELNMCIALAIQSASRSSKSFAEEWQRRYPNTICPFLFNRAMERGGFPDCYQGPRQTIDLETGTKVPSDLQV